MTQFKEYGCIYIVEDMDTLAHQLISKFVLNLTNEPTGIMVKKEIAYNNIGQLSCWTDRWLIRLLVWMA